SFTADEMWHFLPGERVGNVLFATWYDGLTALPDDAAISPAQFDALLKLRDEIAKKLEPMRASGQIGAALDAEIFLDADDAQAHWLRPLTEELRFLFISGDVNLRNGDMRPEATVVASIEPRVFISAEPSQKQKCIRCWHHRADVGAHTEHPAICGRCISNIEGPGEVRRWF
ncbi:MAG: zinc finger domain-containing protein, partial [Luteimonas sp.]